MNNEPIALTQLKTRSVVQLRAMWSEHIDARRPPPKVRMLLLRDLAWAAQEPDRGGLDAETRRLLRAAVKQSSPGSAPGSSRRKLHRTPAQKPRLTPGTKLVRTWRGTRHEVTVLGDGKRFEYRGERYRSLTRIARVITGAHWSGPRFFGLRRGISNLGKSS